MSQLFSLFSVLMCYVISQNDTQRDKPDLIPDLIPYLIPDAIQLVYTTHIEHESVKYNINKEALDIISTLMKDESFEIISAIGSARKGKSYTLSKIIQQMTGLSIVPFKSSDFNTPLTRGIWMYILLKGSSKNNITINSYPCSNDNNNYIFLDIQGSYTDEDDEALRYATIVTLISLQTYLFVHQKLFKHDIEQIRYIQTFIQQMNGQNIEFNINDINLGAIIREPFENEWNNVEKAVHDDLSRYLQFFEGLNNFTAVLPITHFDNINYQKSIGNIIKTISMNTNKQSRMKFTNNAKKLKILLTEIIKQFNDNPDISRVCIFCVFKRIVEWLPYGEFSNCSKKCDGGVYIRRRECNTGKIADCKKYIGGLEIDEQECNTFGCEWLPYGKWSECSKPCKGGMKRRYRKCSTGDKQDCMDMFGGNYIEEQRCNEQKCKWIDKEIDDCSAVCGYGLQTIHLQCETGNDENCEGENYRAQECFNYFGCIKVAFLVIALMIISIWVIYYWCKANSTWVMNVLCVVIIAAGISVALTQMEYLE